MTIHQIQLRHDEPEDRLLLRFSTTDHCEFRFWLTRRFTTRLWKLLVQMLEWDPVVNQQIDPGTRRSVLDLQHEGYTQQADFTQKFGAQTQGTPPRLVLGEMPVLLARAEARRSADGVHVLRLHPLHGQGIDITLDAKLLHIFTRLLRDQVAKTDWDVRLALTGAGGETALPEPQTRTLN
jgi:hypothetical protein